MPQISVVMPAYNAGKYIGEALDSLQAQTFTDWECLIVNDGSTDDTLEIIKRYAEHDPRIRYHTITAVLPKYRVTQRSKWRQANG